MPKTLYVAASFNGSTTLDRKEGLIKAGWDIIHLSSDLWMRNPPRIWRGIHHRVHFGPLIYSFNRAILSTAKREKPAIVWIDKGIWVKPKTVLTLRSWNIIVVHYTPDAAIASHATSNFLKTLPHYNLPITSKKWEMGLYRENGAGKLFHIHQGSSTSRTRPLAPAQHETEMFSSEVVFVGHAETHYIETLRRIVSQIPGLKLKIWGAWGKAVEKHPELKPFWQGKGVFGDDYAKALSGAQIGLGFLSKLIPETETTRTFEIPACGTFLLAERTESHLSLFKEGVEAEFFESPEDASEKIRHYLIHPEKRQAIAQAGYKRFLESDYTTDRFMRDCAREVEKLLPKTPVNLPPPHIGNGSRSAGLT